MSGNLEKQNQRLRSITIRLDNKIKCLLEENQKLRTLVSMAEKSGSNSSENHNFDSKLEKQAIELNTLEAQNKQLRVKIEKLLRTKETLVQNNSNLKRQLSIQEKVLQSDDRNDEELNPRELRKHIKRLELALVKVREEALDKELKSSTTLENLNKKITNLEKEKVRLSKLNHDQDVLKEANKNLKMSLDDLHGTEEKIEFLTLKNVELQSENTKLKRNVDELNELEAVNQQLIENHDLNQKELTNEMENLRKTVSLKQIQLQDMKQKLQRLGRIVIRQNAKGTYRDSIVSTKDQQIEENRIDLISIAQELSNQYHDTISSLLPIHDTAKARLLSKLKGLQFLTSTLAHNYLDHMQIVKYDPSFKKDVEYSVILNKASTLTAYIFHICEYKKSSLSSEAKTTISDYLKDFNQKYDQKLFDVQLQTDDVVCDEALKARELAILELKDTLFLVTIGIGILKARNDFSSKSLMSKMLPLQNLLTQRTDKLLALRQSHLGVDETMVDDNDAFQKFRQYISNICDIFSNDTLDDTDLLLDKEIIQGTIKYLSGDIESHSIDDENYLTASMESVKSASIAKEQELILTKQLDSIGNDSETNEKLQLKIHLLLSKLANLREVEKQHEMTSGELAEQKSKVEALSDHLDKAENAKEVLELELRKLKKVLHAVGLDSCSMEFIDKKEQIQAELSDANVGYLRSQISKQRDLIGRLTKSDGKRNPANTCNFSSFDWLKGDLSHTFTDFQIRKPHRLILEKLFSMEKKFGVAPLEEDSDEKVLKYYAAHMGEQILSYLTEKIS